MSLKTLSLSALLGGAFLFIPSAQAAPSLVKVSSRTSFPVVVLEEGDRLPKTGYPRVMALAKRSYLSGNKKSCLKWSRRVGKGVKSISHWAHVLELKCAMMEKPNLDDLTSVLSRVKKNSHWLFGSHFVQEIREPYIEALVEQAKLLGKSHRVKAWKAIDEALSYREWMSSERRAELYELAGQISFVDQDLLAAKDYFQKSLMIRESGDLRKRLDSILLALRPKKEAVAKENELGFIRGSRASKNEEAIYQRMQSAVASKDYLSAIDDGVNLLVKFPDGAYSSQVEDQVSSLFVGLMTGSSKGWSQIQSRVLRALKKTEGDRLLRWSSLCFKRGKYREGFDLAEEASEKLEGLELAGRAHSIAAQSAHASGDLGLAAKHYRVVVEKFSGSKDYFESLFRLGLAEFRQADYSEAVASFEKLLSVNGGEDFEYRALYWTWRSLQNLKMERAKDLQSLLIEKYPMTLYGMRALAEKSDQTIKLADQKKNPEIKVSLRFLPEQRASWDRFRLLLSGGWLDEARYELDNLPSPQTAEEHLIYSRLYSQSRGYVRAIRHMNKAWELNPEFAYQKEYLLWIFPKAFSKEIAKWSEKRSLEQVWVKSLIRQESAFNSRAVSRSNALGLMQLLPSTAAEVAKDLNKTKFKVPDSLFDPEENVEIGSTYLKRMMSRYQGQLPFALAAYNAGPTRLSRWLDSSGVEVKESELWIDEMPWGETSYYVKAILRNILIFQILDQGQLKISPPIWQISSKSD